MAAKGRLEDFKELAAAAPWHGVVDWATGGGGIVYGAGNGGRAFAEHAAAHGVPIRFFCDDDPGRVGQQIAGREILRGEEIARHPGVPVVIALARFEAIRKKLRGMGVEEGRICFSDDFFVHHVPATQNEKVAKHFDRELLEFGWESLQRFADLLADEESLGVLRGLLKYRLSRSLGDLIVSAYPQYEHPRVKAAAGDLVLDGGAWIGDTAERLSALVAPGGKVFAFEPTPGTFEQLRKNTARLGGVVEPVNAGLGAKNGAAAFSTAETDTGSFHVVGELQSGGDLQVSIIAVDSFCRERKIAPAMFKMDIEGSELDAIEGAKETIRLHAPKLAICVYHKFADLWEIPLRLHALHPGYRFYLGQHARGITETVVYASEGGA